MNKETYLKEFYKSLNERLQQMISSCKNEYLNSLSDDDRNSVMAILDKEEFSLLDINDLLIDYSPKELDDVSLFALVYRYFETITPDMVTRDLDMIKGDLVFLDLSVRHRLDKVPTNVPRFLMLPILSYLISTSNKYQTLTRELYGNYLTCLENDFVMKYLETSKLDISLIFDKLSTITTDPNYEITFDDIKLLSSFLLYKRYLPGMKMKEIMTVVENIKGTNDILISYWNTNFPFVTSNVSFDDAMKVYSHFFKLELPEKCANRYLYAKETFDSIAKQEYSKEECRQISLLLHTLLSQRFYQVPRYSIENFRFDDILDFIKKYEETGLVVSSADLSYLLDKFVVNNSSFDPSFDRLIKYKFQSYAKQQFPFEFDKFCSFMNQESFDFSSYKYEGTKEFDFSMYVRFLTNEDYHLIAGYFDPLMETKSGKALLIGTISACRDNLKHREDVYSVDTYQRFYPYLSKLATLTDYTLDYFLLDFVEKEDYEKVRVLCNWVDEHNPTFFNNSIRNSDIESRNNQRIINNIEKYFSETPLKELTKENILKYWNSLKNPFSETDRYPMKRACFMSYSDIIQKRLDAIALLEVKNMELCLQEGGSLLDYIAKQEYNEEQAFQLISTARNQMPNLDEQFLLLEQNLRNQIITRDDNNKYNQQVSDTMNRAKEAYMLMTLFLNGNYSSMGDFYNDAFLKLGIHVSKQTEILKSMFNSSPEVLDAYQKRREIIANGQADRLSEINKKRAQERLKANIDIYGEESVRIMKKFVDSDDTSITKFCASQDLSMKDFKFYRKLCSHVDENVSSLVDDKAADIRRKFISAMARTSYFVAREMLSCHKNHIPYDMLEHYQKYGYSPVFIKDFALSLHKDKEARIIDQYMSLHPEPFKSISAVEIAGMERTSHFTPRNIYLDAKGEVSVSYLAKDLGEAVDELLRLEVPITKGTVFGMLKQIQGTKEDVSKYHIKK